MSRVKRFRIGRATAAAGSALLPLLAAAAVPAMAASAASSPSVVNLYVAPHAAGMTAAAAQTGSAQQPFTSVAQAAQSAHQLSASSDVVVHMAAGRYPLAQPLTFTSANAGQNGHTITYAGAASQATVMSGSAPGDWLDAAELGEQHLGGQRRHRGELAPAVRQRRGGAAGRDRGATLRLHASPPPG